MAEICSKSHSSRLFTIVRENKSMLTEISTLIANSTNGDPFGQVYNDSCDEGFNIVSARTGRSATFVVSRHVEDQDGDVTGIVLVPTKQTIQKTPLLKGWLVTVLND